MPGKDLFIVILEILRKHTKILNRHTEMLKKTNETLNYLVDISIRQFQQQQHFNERFVNKLDEIANKLN